MCALGEKRTERIGLVLTPAVSEKIKKLSKFKGVSLNGLMHEVIEREIEMNKESLKKYEEFVDENKERKDEYGKNI